MEVLDGARRSGDPESLGARAPGGVERQPWAAKEAVHHERDLATSVLRPSDCGAAVSQPDLAGQAPRRGRVVSFLVGLVAFPGLAAMTGLLAIFVLYGTASAAAGLVVWLLAMAAPIVLLVRRGGWLRGLAYGMIASAAVLVVATVGVSLLFSSGESAERQLADIAAHSSTPVYYPGPSFEGHDFDDVVIFSHNSESGSDTDHSFDRGDRLDLGYGSTCSFFTTDETCGDLVDLQMYRDILPFPPGFCSERHDGPRGTVLVREPLGAWDAFTGDLVVRVEEVDEQDMVDLVTALRVIGDRTGPTGSQLPPPSATALHQIKVACRQ
jgi:hypothetical protein